MAPVSWLFATAVCLCWPCQAMRSVTTQAGSASRSLECSSVLQTPPAARSEEQLQDHEKGGDWHLIAIVSGYNAKPHSTAEVLASQLCEASFGAPSKSLIVVLESNLGIKSVESIQEQGHRAAAEIQQLLQWNQRQGRMFSGYSLVGHSLGGLVARVVAAELAELDVKPRVFVSMFSPNAGLESFVAAKLMPAVLSLGQIDRGAAKEVLEEKLNQSILVQLSQGSYAKAFRSFEKRVLYGSPADWLVDFNSAVLSSCKASNVQLDAEIEEEYPLLHLRTFQETSARATCLDDSVRCFVLKQLADVPIHRVQVDWSPYQPQKHSQKDMTHPELLELTRHLALELGSSFALPRGAKCAESHDYCAQALECRQGRCQPQLLTEEDCVEGMLGECQHVMEMVNDVLKQMTLIVTSSGGGGHLVAARNLQETLLQEAERLFQTIETLLSSSGVRVLKPEAALKAKTALRQVQAGQPALEMLDLMKSDCTGLGGFQFGDMMSQQWNRLQRAGDIASLKSLVKKQPWTQTIFGSSCTIFMRKVCGGSNLHGLPVTRLYTTQPLLLKSLMNACTATLQVDLFMTDLPTLEAVHFFQPLKSIEAELALKWKRKFYLHTLPPPEGGAAELERLSGVPRNQIFMEKFMPVNRAFTRPDGLPQPGEMFALKLTAQLPLEEKFLQELGNPLLVQPEDEVILVMLGSQPTASAVDGYAKENLKLPAPSTGTRYVLLACGKPKVEAYAKLYTDMVQLATDSKGRSATVLVPFTGQDAKEMLGRADITITRSGGLTAGELLALRTRKDDKKQMLLHVESVPDREATMILAKHLQNQQQEVAMAAALEDSGLQGMVPWEAGNARYLQTAVGAKLVTPKIFVAAMGNEFALPFNVDWSTLLYMRGFGADQIAFATAPGASCEAAVCERGMSDLPLPETVAGGNSACLRALRDFDGGSSASPLAFTLNQDVVANRRGRLINGHSCNDAAAFMVRQRPSAMKAYFFDIDSMANAVVAACGGSIMTCGKFITIKIR